MMDGDRQAAAAAAAAQAVYRYVLSRARQEETAVSLLWQRWRAELAAAGLDAWRGTVGLRPCALGGISVALIYWSHWGRWAYVPDLLTSDSPPVPREITVQQVE